MMSDLRDRRSGEAESGFGRSETSSVFRLGAGQSTFSRSARGGDRSVSGLSHFHGDKVKISLGQVKGNPLSDPSKLMNLQGGPSNQPKTIRIGGAGGSVTIPLGNMNQSSNQQISIRFPSS